MDKDQLNLEIQNRMIFYIGELAMNKITLESTINYLTKELETTKTEIKNLQTKINTHEKSSTNEKKS